VTSSRRFGPFLIDRHAYRILRDGQTVAMSPKHLDLLLHLLDHAGDLTKERDACDAIDAAWLTGITDATSTAATIDPFRNTAVQRMYPRNVRSCQPSPIVHFRDVPIVTATALRRL
jgi:hypothetical protein